MPWYGLIHPLLAVGTLVLGIVTAQTSISRTEDWDFPLRRQRLRSVVFFLLCVANLILGLLVAAALRGRGVGVQLALHVPLAVGVVVFSLVAVVATFVPPRRPGELPSIMHFHAWFLVLPLVMMLTMGFIALLAAFGI